MADEALDLQAIKARCDAATEGPWGAADEHGLMPNATPAWCVSRNGVDGDWLYDLAYMPQTKNPAQEAANATFMAAARSDVPALLDRLERIAALHREGVGLGAGFCLACSTSWPCATLRLAAVSS